MAKAKCFYLHGVKYINSCIKYLLQMFLFVVSFVYNSGSTHGKLATSLNVTRPVSFPHSGMHFDIQRAVLSRALQPLAKKGFPYIIHCGWRAPVGACSVRAGWGTQTKRLETQISCLTIDEKTRFKHVASHIHTLGTCLHTLPV